MPLDIAPRPAPADNHDQFEVVADGLGRYTIDVSLPPGADRGDARYPVALVVDGNLLFDVVQVTLHGRFVRMSNSIPPAILVGVGYPADEGLASFYARRNYDFHGPWPMTDPLGRQLQDIFAMLKTAEGKPEMVMGAGGYDRFMAFLCDELLPSLAMHYPIDPNARHTLIGDSSGGHFALRALYDPASPFKRYVCISPSFGAGDGAIPKAEAAYAAGHDDLDVDLFICCGRVEVDREPMMALCRFGSGVTWVAEQFALRRWPSARIEWEIMNHEDHASIPQRAMAAGLRSVYRVRPGVHEAEIGRIQAAAMEAMARREAESAG
jgi:predicted alpha/beta superfamily hydrolase